MRKFSQIVSFVFHPMLMPSLGLFLILNAGTHLSFLPFEVRRLLYIIVFASSCLLPLSLLPLFLQFRVIKTFKMETARERIWPLLFSGLFFLMGYFLLIRLRVPDLILEFLFASLVAVIIALCVSYFWKVSLHMLGVGGVTAMLFGIVIRFGVDLLVPVSFLLAVGGMVGTARLYLGAHNIAQVGVGYLIGFSVVLMGLFF